MTGAPLFLVDALPPGDRVVLAGPEGRHAARVRRLAPGERAAAGDGAGAVAEGVVEAVRGDEVVLRIDRRRAEPPPRPRLVVVQALPKGERGETAVETLTEVGVDVIVPWAAARCVAQWKGERGDRALRRWRATAREAGKQSRRAWLPRVEPLAATADVARWLAGAALRVVLDEQAAAPIGGLAVPAGGDVVIVVGPEGGLTPEERALLGPAVSLGPTVLRTSTAGTVAAGVLLSRTARWAATRP